MVSAATQKGIADALAFPFQIATSALAIVRHSDICPTDCVMRR